MTGKDAILNYLKTHKTCSSPDVAAASGMTHTCINQAANILAKQGVLVAEARVWRTVYYRLATEEEISGRKSTNQIFNECRPKPGDEAGTGCLRENISMTITLQAVNELIASLESAGELSIREQKFLKLAKAYQQLAAENVQIKAMNDCLSEELRGYESDGAFEGPKIHLLWWQVETPATDRIVAGIKADGVASVKSAFEKHIQSTSCYQDEIVGMESALSISCQVESQLREGANHD
ncbi:Uncharacterised protein [Klebsiella pneumoniae]|nr:Uncharacterised protein [Klebsiella pneumoniae]